MFWEKHFNSASKTLKVIFWESWKKYPRQEIPDPKPAELDLFSIAWIKLEPKKILFTVTYVEPCMELCASFLQNTDFLELFCSVQKLCGSRCRSFFFSVYGYVKTLQKILSLVVKIGARCIRKPEIQRRSTYLASFSLYGSKTPTCNC